MVRIPASRFGYSRYNSVWKLAILTGLCSFSETPWENSRIVPTIRHECFLPHLSYFIAVKPLFIVFIGGLKKTVDPGKQ
jgi:hypothetical protein